MKSSFYRFLLPAVILVVVVSGHPQTPSSHYDPAPSSTDRRQKSFTESALARINLRDIDYGQRIEDARRTAIEATVENYYFWSNLVSAAVAVGMFLYALYLYRMRQHMTFTAAELATAHQNQLAVAQAHIADLSAKFRQLRSETDTQREAGVAVKSAVAKSTLAAAGRGNNGKDAAVSSQPAPSPVERQLRDEKEKLNQQLARANESITSLRQQVATLTGKIEEEQRKNRRLRGE